MASQGANPQDPAENVFQVRNLSDEKKTVHEGTIEVTDSALIYSDSKTHRKRLWPLKYIKRYGCHGDIFSFEAGRQCAGGQGLYAFQTNRASILRDLVARNMLREARYQAPRSSLVPQLGTNSSLGTFPQRLAMSMPQLNEAGDGTGPMLPSRTGMSRFGGGLISSISIQNLPSAVYEVKNVGDDPSSVQRGFLEVTSTDLIYSDSATPRKYYWPLKFLRRYGCDGDVFSFEAGRRCPGGEGSYAFSTSHALEIRNLIRRNINMGSYQSPRRPSCSPPPTPASAPPQTPIRYHNLSNQVGDLQTLSAKDDMRYLSRSPSPQRSVFGVRTIAEDKEVVQEGMLEVTITDIIYVDGETSERWYWPLKYLRKYGCEGDVFSIEAGRRCPGGAGMYAFSTPQALEIRETVERNIAWRNRSQAAHGTSLPAPSQRVNSPLYATSPSPPPQRSSSSPISTRRQPPGYENVHQKLQSPCTVSQENGDASQSETSSVASQGTHPSQRKSQYHQVFFDTPHEQSLEVPHGKIQHRTSYSRINFEARKTPSRDELGHPEPSVQYENKPIREESTHQKNVSNRSHNSLSDSNDLHQVSPTRRLHDATLTNGTITTSTPKQGNVYENVAGLRDSPQNVTTASSTGDLRLNATPQPLHAMNHENSSHTPLVSYQNISCSSTDTPLLLESSNSYYANIGLDVSNGSAAEPLQPSYALVEFPDNPPSNDSSLSHDVPDAGNLSSAEQPDSTRPRIPCSSKPDDSRVVYGQLNFKVMEAISQLHQQREQENIQKQQQKALKEREKEKSATHKRHKKDHST